MKRANEKAGPVRRESAPDGTRVVNASPDDWAWYGEERRVYPRNSAVNDADDFAAVLEHRNRPDHPYEPLQSNWSTTPEGVVEYEMTGEGKRDAVRPAQDLHLEVTPSIEEILRAMAGDWVWKQEPVDPAEPKMPRGELVGEIGHLLFSDGMQRERAHKVQDGQVGVYLRRMPRGAMLGCTERTGAAHGTLAAAGAVVSNTHLASMLKVSPRPFTPRGPIQGGRSMTAAERRADLALAIANTPVMPPVTYCPPGVANGTAKASDCFLGMKVHAKGRGGAIGWVDFYVAARDREEWLATLDALDESTRTVLDASLRARSYAEVGEAVGQSTEYARRKGGKAKLRAANDNLVVEMRKHAA